MGGQIRTGRQPQKYEDMKIVRVQQMEVGDKLSWNNMLNLEYEEWDENVDGFVTVIFTDNGETAFSECLNMIRNHLD